LWAPGTLDEQPVVSKQDDAPEDVIDGVEPLPRRRGPPRPQRSIGGEALAAAAHADVGSVRRIGRHDHEVGVVGQQLVAQQHVLEGDVAAGNPRIHGGHQPFRHSRGEFAFEHLHHVRE
jgi:hypothetical protein